MSILLFRHQHVDVSIIELGGRAYYCLLMLDDMDALERRAKHARWL